MRSWRGFFFPRPRDPGAIHETGTVGVAGAIIRVYDRNAVSAPDYFLIPSTRVVELGTRVEM